jgi:hypothetical protein
MNLLETNIYDAKGKVLICGTCLPRMQEKGFRKLEKEFDTILYLCLEKEHINMAITKICGMISTNKIESLTFASVNKSPHCTQMHYIKHELERVMKTPKIENIIIENNEIYKISNETLELSKNLVKLENNN